jgi:cell division septal protein FtsQ
MRSEKKSKEKAAKKSQKRAEKKGRKNSSPFPVAWVIGVFVIVVVAYIMYSLR